MSSAEGSEAGSEARADRWDAFRLGCVDPEGLPGAAVGHFQLSLPVPPYRSGLSEEAHQGDLRDACPLWVPLGVLYLAPGRLAGEQEEGLPALQGVGPAAAQQDPPKRRVKAKLRPDRTTAIRPNDV